MTFKTHACFTIHCDTCGETIDNDGFTPHFDNEEQAREQAREYDWLVKADGSVFCDNHAPICLCDDCEDDDCGYEECPKCPRHAPAAAADPTPDPAQL